MLIRTTTRLWSRCSRRPTMTTPRSTHEQGSVNGGNRRPLLCRLGLHIWSDWRHHTLQQALGWDEACGRMRWEFTYTWRRDCQNCGFEDVRPSKSHWEFPPFSLREFFGRDRRGIEVSFRPERKRR